jgi:hypothetical protein
MKVEIKSEFQQMKLDRAAEDDSDPWIIKVGKGSSRN